MLTFVQILPLRNQRSSLQRNTRGNSHIFMYLVSRKFRNFEVILSTCLEDFKWNGIGDRGKISTCIQREFSQNWLSFFIVSWIFFSFLFKL
jgi:hypothetical protein